MNQLLIKLIILLFIFVLFLPPDNGLATEAESPLDTVIYVGYNPEHPPFAYVDDEGYPVGFFIDILEQIGRQAEFNFQFVAMNANQFLPQLEAGKIDVILGMKYRSSFNDFVDFSDTFFTESEVLVVPKENKEIYSLSHLKDKIVALESGSSAMDYLRDIRNVNMNLASTQTRALDLLLHGRADAFIGNDRVVQYYLAKHNLEEAYEIRIHSIHIGEYAFAVRKGNHALIVKLNEKMKELHQSGEFHRIYSRWFDAQISQDSRWKKLSFFLALFSIIVSIVMFIIYMVNKRLKVEIDRHTHTLKNNVAFQKQILDTIDSGILSIKGDGMIQLANRRAVEILQLENNPVGTSIFNSHQFKEIEKIILLTQNNETYEGEIIFEEGAPKGKKLYIQYYTAVLRMDDPSSYSERQPGWIVSLQDRTRERSLQNKLILQEKLRSLGQLIAGIAHELRNPLTSMKMFIELLPYKFNDPRYRQELLKHVPAELDRLNHVVEDLLDYTRSKTPEKEWVNLYDFLTSILRSFEIQYSQEEIEYQILFDQGTYFYFDRQQLKQVMINLIANGIEAMLGTERKVITFKTRITDKSASLQISDTGIGIPAEEIPEIFQPFHTSKANGVGLGLYICYNILHEHTGDLDVQSTVGKGTTFILKFKREDFKCIPS